VIGVDAATKRTMNHRAITLPMLILSGILVLWPQPARTQEVRGALRGKLVSASANVPPSGGSAPVYTVPDPFVFVLTQLCINADVSLSGSKLGAVVPGGKDCSTFSPGIVFAPQEVLTCTNAGATAESCMITGVLTTTKK